MAKECMIAGYAYEVYAVFVRGGQEDWSWRNRSWRDGTRDNDTQCPGYNVEEFRLARGTQTGLFTARNRFRAHGDPKRYGKRLFLWPGGKTQNTRHIAFEEGNLLIPPRGHVLQDWDWQGECFPIVYVPIPLREEYADLCEHHAWRDEPKQYKITLSPRLKIALRPRLNYFMCKSQQDADELLSYFKLRL